MALERRKITMRSVTLAPDGTILNIEATDYVDLAHIDGYVAAKRDAGWQYIDVGTEPDDGPGGPDGAYTDPTTIGA